MHSWNVVWQWGLVTILVITNSIIIIRYSNNKNDTKGQKQKQTQNRLVPLCSMTMTTMAMMIIQMKFWNYDGGIEEKSFTNCARLTHNSSVFFCKTSLVNCVSIDKVKSEMRKANMQIKHNTFSDDERNEDMKTLNCYGALVNHTEHSMLNSHTIISSSLRFEFVLNGVLFKFLLSVFRSTFLFRLILQLNIVTDLCMSFCIVIQ